MAPLTAKSAVRSTLAGAAGTAALSLFYDVERRIRSRHRGPLDYDDSLVPGQIVASVMHLGRVTDREENELGLILRWGYGSGPGSGSGTACFAGGSHEPWASALFGGTLMSATLSLFPLLGRTPPPWRWPPDVVGTCLGSHAAYVITVGAVDDALRPG